MAVTALAQAVLGISDAETRKDVLSAVHPLYAQHSDSWQVFLDAFEGSGGFLDGSYLWRYPNEVPQDFEERQKQARYHNYARALVNIYLGHLLSRDIQRTTTTDLLNAWWLDVDGNGTPATTFMRRAIAVALAVGHAGILIDKTRDEPVGPAAADERARVVARLYLPQAILDWRTPSGALKALKLREVVESDNLLAVGDDRETARVLLWSETEWARFTADGDLIDEGVHALGFVPCFILRPIASASDETIGHSLFGNANLFRALYNRCSEEDQTLRGQAFSVLTVNVPTDGNVAEVKNQLGTDIGTMRALVLNGQANYITADMGAPEQIRTNIAFLIEELYRMAEVPFRSTSREAESAEALSLKHRALNDRLTSMAVDLERVEMGMARAWFGWMSPTPEAAEAAQQASETAIRYPREFFIADMLAELEKWAQAIALRLGTTYEQQIRKTVVRQLSPNLPLDMLSTIDQEIDAQPTNQEMAPTLKERQDALLAEPKDDDANNDADDDGA